MQTAFGGVFRGLPVLVTGHTGFKGSWMSIWLNELGAKVIGYSRDSGEKPRNIDMCGLRERINHAKGDTRNAEQLKEVIARHQPQLVIHMAAQSLVKVSYQEPKRTFDTNVEGTVNLLEAIRQTQSVKAFIGVTTDKVYADQNWVWGYRENDPLGGHDPYSASKSMAELAIQSYRSSWSSEKSFADHPVAIATTRGGNVIGGGDFAQYRLVPDCMRALMTDQPIEIGNPQSVRPWQHVLELLSGYLWLAVHLLHEADKRLCGDNLRASDTYSEAWNFGPAEHESVNCETIVKKVVDLWGKGSYRVADQSRKDKPHETFMLRLNWVKSATRLGWRPTYAWERAVEVIVNWFKEYEQQERRQASGGPAVNMYDCCVQQIKDYLGCARKLGASWAG